MTEDQINTLLEIQHRQMVALERIADTLDRLAPKSAPNYQRSMEEFRGFDWESIGARIEKSDQYGAAVVNWGGYQFIRRSPNNKFGKAIWFSRCTGKGEDGSNVYEKLITFKPLAEKEAEPLPEKVRQVISDSF